MRWLASVCVVLADCTKRTCWLLGWDFGSNQGHSLSPAQMGCHTTYKKWGTCQYLYLIVTLTISIIFAHKYIFPKYAWSKWIYHKGNQTIFKIVTFQKWTRDFDHYCIAITFTSLHSTEIHEITYQVLYRVGPFRLCLVQGFIVILHLLLAIYIFVGNLFLPLGLLDDSSYLKGSLPWKTIISMQ